LKILLLLLSLSLSLTASEEPNRYILSTLVLLTVNVWDLQNEVVLVHEIEAVLGKQLEKFECKENEVLSNITKVRSPGTIFVETTRLIMAFSH
jgi:CII-binding regulator of phage lambda lysogenization HflD